MYQGRRRTIRWTATNAVEPIAPVSRQTLFTGLTLTIVEYGASYRPGSQPPCQPFSHDPKNPLSHDLDPVMAALSAQIGPTLTFSLRLVPTCQNGCATTPHTHLTCSLTPSITGCGETIHARIHGDTHTPAHYMLDQMTKGDNHAHTHTRLTPMVCLFQHTPPKDDMAHLAITTAPAPRRRRRVAPVPSSFAGNSSSCVHAPYS
jgi:hypothetical protein